MAGVATASAAMTTTGASTIASTGASVTTSRPIRSAAPLMVTVLPGEVRKRSSGKN